MISKITKGHKEFDFEVYFSEVFHEKGGFDVVVGNPPYGADIPKEQLKQIRRYKDKIHGDQCKMEQKIYNKIESEYESYFIFYGMNGNNGYDWAKGNNKLKNLLK